MASFKPSSRYTNLVVCYVAGLTGRKIDFSNNCHIAETPDSLYSIHVVGGLAGEGHMIIALINKKGGVGKTTLAANLTVWLAEQGHSVCMIDADAQRSSSIWLQEAAPEIAHSRLETQDELHEEAPRLAAEYEFVVVDAPGGLSELPRAILFIADLVLLPCGPTTLDLRAANDTIRVLRQVQSIRKGPPKAIFVPNKIRKRNRLSKEFMETAATLDIAVSSGLRLLDAYADAVGQGTVVWKMGPNAKEAADDIQNLFKELLRDESATTTVDELSVANH